MKKRFFLLTALTAFSAAAYLPGEQAGEIKELKWQKEWFSVAPLTDDEAKETPLRVVTILLTRADAAPDAAAMMERYRKEGIPCAIITPDAESDLKQFAAARPHSAIPMAWDKERKVSAKYLDGSRIFPASFVVDGKGIVLWRGESMDLPEMLQNWRAGKFSLKTQQKLAPLLLELESYLRGGRESEIRRLTREIFDLDPANAAALRMRLFMLENSGKAPEAWELLDSQIKLMPALPRLYFTALDIAARHGELREPLRALLPVFSKNVTDPAARDMMAWNLLNAFPEDAGMLGTAAELIANYNEDARSDGELGFHRMVQALIAYRLGRVDQAVTFQKQAAALIRRAGGTGDAEVRLEYYEKVRALQDKIK